MIQALTLNEFVEYAKKSKKIAVFRELALAGMKPVEVYSAINQLINQDGMIFEDYSGDTPVSVICFEPVAKCDVLKHEKAQPADRLQQFQAAHPYMTRPDIARLCSHTMGVVTYDAISLQFTVYSLSIRLDHDKQSILISVLVDVDEMPEQVYAAAQQKINDIYHTINNYKNDKALSGLPRPAKNAGLAMTALAGIAADTHLFLNTRPSTDISVDLADDEFVKMVEQAKSHIMAGDVFQLVLSRNFQRQHTQSPLTVYKALTDIAPAPFMFYLSFNGQVIIGASPERLVRIQDQTITVNPIAGTRKREKGNDQQIAEALLADRKEVAEHMMLVDLARNDVGRVSVPGTVTVQELLTVKHFSHVSHIISTVTGTMQPHENVFSAFFAAFPAGTLTGAPKIRAMELIDEIETSPRGLYGGAICRLDLAGNLDSCIAIRMTSFEKGVATIRTGAGIVFDSDPLLEAQETRHKASAILHAIALAEGETHDINY